MNRRSSFSQGRSFMINDILQNRSQNNFADKESKEFRALCGVHPLLQLSRNSQFNPTSLPLSNRIRPSGLNPFVNATESLANLSQYAGGRNNPYLKFGFNFDTSQTGYLLSRAAELMSANCVLPPLPIPFHMQHTYDHLPMYMRDRFFNYPDHGGAGSRKCRRSRTVFSELQLMALEERFNQQKYLSTPDRMELAEGLGLTQLQVKTWYQNRRMKWKKQVQQKDLGKHNLEPGNTVPESSITRETEAKSRTANTSSYRDSSSDAEQDFSLGCSAATFALNTKSLAIATTRTSSNARHSGFTLFPNVSPYDKISVGSRVAKTTSASGF